MSEDGRKPSKVKGKEKAVEEEMMEERKETPQLRPGSQPQPQPQGVAWFTEGVENELRDSIRLFMTREAVEALTGRFIPPREGTHIEVEFPVGGEGVRDRRRLEPEPPEAPGVLEFPVPGQGPRRSVAAGPSRAGKMHLLSAM
jgi:hypothetical protein